MNRILTTWIGNCYYTSSLRFVNSILILNLSLFSHRVSSHFIYWNCSSSSPITALSTHHILLFVGGLINSVRYIMERLNRFSIYLSTSSLHLLFSTLTQIDCVSVQLRSFPSEIDWAHFRLLCVYFIHSLLYFIRSFPFSLLSMATHLTVRACVCDTCKWAKHQAI